MVHFHIFYLLTLSCHDDDNCCKLTCGCKRNDNHKNGRKEGRQLLILLLFLFDVYQYK